MDGEEKASQADNLPQSLLLKLARIRIMNPICNRHRIDLSLLSFQICFFHGAGISFRCK